MLRIFKILLWIFLLVIALVLLAFMKLQPSAVAYTPYNEMYNAYCMYYLDNTGAYVDPEPDMELLIEKRKPRFQKKCEADSFKISVPLLMLFDWRKKIGNPGMNEQGGIVLEFKLLGITKRFTLDPLEHINYYPSLTEEIFNKIHLIDEAMKEGGEEILEGQPTIQLGS